MDPLTGTEQEVVNGGTFVRPAAGAGATILIDAYKDDGHYTTDTTAHNVRLGHLSGIKADIGNNGIRETSLQAYVGNRPMHTTLAIDSTSFVHGVKFGRTPTPRLRDRPG